MDKYFWHVPSTPGVGAMIIAQKANIIKYSIESMTYKGRATTKLVRSINGESGTMVGIGVKKITLTRPCIALTNIKVDMKFEKLSL